MGDAETPKDSGADADADQEVLAFTLTDPDRLNTQLDEAQLDDEETELLLEEAMKLNARLKQVLRHQQLDESPPPGHGGGRGKGQGHGNKKTMGSHPLQGQLPRRTHPERTLGSGKAKLPPIGSTTAGGGGGVAVRSSIPKESKSPPTKKGARQGSAKKKPVDNRPAWDDRFSF